MTDAATILSSLAQTGQPQATFAAIDAIIQERIGHKQFTLLVLDGDEIERVYSTTPREYPVSGRKTMGPTPWGDLVLKQMKPFLGRTMDDIRWAFYDHELIQSMGLGSIINLPVIYNGTCLGAICVSNAEHFYTEADMDKIADLVPLLIPGFLLARQTA